MIDTEKCLACDETMTNDKQVYKACHQISHNKCFSNSYEQCYSCQAIEKQRSESSTTGKISGKTNEVIDHQVTIINMETEVTETNSCIEVTQTVQTTSNHMNNTVHKVVPVKDTEESVTLTLPDKHEQQTRQNELKEQEVKLKKTRGAIF